jgi:hypothetical protein
MRISTALFVPAALLTLAACGEKKDTEPAAPIEGWHAEENWVAQCWFPIDYDAVQENQGTTARSEARQEALEAMMSQWRGNRDDGVAMRASAIENVEITLLGRPTLIEEVSRQNAEQCKAVMVAGAGDDETAPSLGDINPWKTWFGSLNGDLNEGECRGGLEDTLFYYLEIDGGWQLTVPVCEGMSFMIGATEGDKYRISEDGPWINADGDLDQLTMGSETLPCNLEGCYAGMLVMRFTTDSGIETIIPAGVETLFNVPAHGTLTFRINDTTFFDNTWYQSGGIIDHTGISITPQ